MKKPAEMRRVAPALIEAHGDSGVCFSIGVVADFLGVTEQTLRLYEAHGLVKPARRKRERYYCAGDVQWLECLRRLIHAEKGSTEGVKRLLHFAPCWEITGFPEAWQCGGCPVYRAGCGGPMPNRDPRRVPPADRAAEIGPHQARAGVQI